MEQLREYLISKHAEDIKVMLLDLCNHEDVNIQGALKLLFSNELQHQTQAEKKVPPPPPVRKNMKPVKSRARAQGITDTKSPVQARSKERTLTIDEQKPVSLQYILKEPTLCLGFKKFLEKQFCEENLLFVQKAAIFKDTVETFSPKQQFVLVQKNRFISFNVYFKMY